MLGSRLWGSLWVSFIEVQGFMNPKWEFPKIGDPNIAP